MARHRSTRRAASSGRTAASARRSPAASSTCPRSRPTSRPGRRPTALGRPGGRGARGSAADRRARARPTSTTAASRPFGRTWGAPFAPSDAVSDRRAAVVCDPFPPTIRDPLPRRRRLRPAAGPTGPTGGRLPTPKPRPPPADAEAGQALELDDRRPVAALAALAGTDRLDQRVVARPPTAPRRAAAPVPIPWMISDLVEPGQRRRRRGSGSSASSASSTRAPRRSSDDATDRARSSRSSAAFGRCTRRPSRCRAALAGAVAERRHEVVGVDRDAHPARLEGHPLAHRARARRSGPPSRPTGCAPARRAASVRGSTAGSATGAGLGLGQRGRGRASARATAVVEGRRGDRLALERLARRADLGPQVRRRSARPRSGRRATASSRSRRARRRSSWAARSASAARSSAARARSSASLGLALGRLDRGERRLERLLRLGQPRAGVADDLLGQPEPLGDRERLAAAGQADRQAVGRADSVSRSNSTAALRAAGVVWA